MELRPEHRTRLSRLNACGVRRWRHSKVLRSTQVIPTLEPTVPKSLSTQAQLKTLGIVTPANTKQLQVQIATLLRSNPDDQAICLLFSKADKRITILQFENAKQELLIAEQSKLTEEQRLCRRRRVATGANVTLTSITSIITAQDQIKQQKTRWETLDRLEEARNSSFLLIQQGMEASLREWHVSDLIDV